MAGRINLLTKQELIYELRWRGVHVEDETFYELRSKLRAIVKVGVNPNVNNLFDFLKAGDELGTISKGLEIARKKTEEAIERESVNDYVKCEAKLTHYRARLNNFCSLFKVKDEGEAAKAICKMKDELVELQSLIESAKFSENDITRVEAELCKSAEEEDNVYANPIQHSTGEQPLSYQTANTDTARSPGHTQHNTPSAHQYQSITYAKLPNPLEKYLSNYNVTDGLNAYQMIQFIRNMLTMKSETNLSDYEILELSLTYTKGPLHDKMLQCKNDNLSLHDTHLLLLKQFVPMGLREQLKLSKVIRPQRYNEPLESFISEVKDYANVLDTRFTETELVDIIKQGINPDTRNKLVFVGNPKTFNDLNEICVSVQNVSFNDTVRKDNKSQLTLTTQKSSPYKGYTHHTSPQTTVNTLVCTYCKKTGHTMEYCFLKKKHNKEESHTNRTPMRNPNIVNKPQTSNISSARHDTRIVNKSQKSKNL